MLFSINHFLRNLFIPACIFIAGCTKEAQYIDTVTPSENTAITSVDTFQTSYSIQRLDSFQTSGTGVIVAGIHTDPVFGKTNSTSFFRFSLPGTDNPIKENNNLRYDSLVLIMNMSKDYYGDTISNFNISAYRLRDDIVSESNVFYNTSRFAAYPDALGSFNQRLRPAVSDSIAIRLSDDLGKEIFGFYKSNSSEITSTDNFQRYFKGITIQANENTNVLYGFKATDSTVRMRLYYHADISVKEKRTLDFTLQSGQFQFNHITTNTTGTPLQTLLPGKEISSVLLDNHFFIFPLAGIKTNIKFPSIKNILTVEGYVKILNASLQLKPVKGSYDEYPLMSSLNVFLQNSDLSYIGPLSLNNKTQTGNLAIDNLYGENTFYSYNVSGYASSEIISSVYTTQKLVPYPFIPAINAGAISFGRFVAVDGVDQKYRSKLVTQILTYKK